MNLATLRIQLAEAKNALRDDKATLETIQAVAEYGMTIIGKNADALAVLAQRKAVDSVIVESTIDDWSRR